MLSKGEVEKLEKKYDEMNNASMVTIYVPDICKDVLALCTDLKRYIDKPFFEDCVLNTIYIETVESRLKKVERRLKKVEEGSHPPKKNDTNPLKPTSIRCRRCTNGHLINDTENNKRFCSHCNLIQ